MKINAPAKVNITLDITARRADGYHELDMIMLEIPLYDTLEITAANRIILTSDDSSFLCDNTNIAWRCAESFFEYTGIDGGVHINIEKKIPYGAGLGGGSSDGAAVLKGLNEIYNTGLTAAQLRELGKINGADIPFFIEGGCCIARGIGDKLEQIGCLSNCHMAVFKPTVSVNTATAYSNLNFNDFPSHISTREIADRINDITFVCRNMFNMFEPSVIGRYPVIGKVKQAFLRSGADGTLMSGSGSCVFAIFTDKDKMMQCGEFFKNISGDLYFFQFRELFSLLTSLINKI